MYGIEIHPKDPVAIIDAEAYTEIIEGWQAKTVRLSAEIDSLRSELVEIDNNHLTQCQEIDSLTKLYADAKAKLAEAEAALRELVTEWGNDPSEDRTHGQFTARAYIAAHPSGEERV